MTNDDDVSAKIADVEQHAARLLAMFSHEHHAPEAEAYDTATVRLLDVHLNEMRSGGVDPSEVADALTVFGYLLGEVLVRAGGGAWQPPDRAVADLFPELVVRMPDGRVANPITKPLRRVRDGLEDDLLTFYRYFTELGDTGHTGAAPVGPAGRPAMSFNDVAEAAADVVALAGATLRTRLTYSPTDARTLDALLPAVAGADLEPDEALDTLTAFGCFLGEVLVRRCGATWVVPTTRTAAPAVIVLKGGSVVDVIEIALSAPNHLPTPFQDAMGRLLGADT